jgi:putative ABC transport system substrate-binding protein
VTPRRRDFITLLCGAAAAWPITARAQQRERVRRIGVLTGVDSPVNRANLAVFQTELARLGWVEERNVRIDVRFGGADADLFRAGARDLVGLDTDVIVVGLRAALIAVEQLMYTKPIVIVGTGDVASIGDVKNLANPEGNITGVVNLFGSIGGKWLQLLKEVAPTTERVGLIVNPGISASFANNVGYRPSIEETARVIGVQTVEILYNNSLELVRATDAFAAKPNGGLIVMPPPGTPDNRRTIIELALQHRLPTIFQDRQFIAEGGLLSYGTNSSDLWRRVPYYVDRILRDAKVSELPIEYPTKFEMSINLKTAKAIGLTIPESFLARADEVIE